MVSYKVATSGSYQLEIQVNGQHIASSPFSMLIIAGVEEQEAQQQRKRQALRALSNVALARVRTVIFLWSCHRYEPC